MDIEIKNFESKERLKSTYQLLIVEDEKLLCWSIAQVLKKSGYNVKVAYSGEKAIEKIFSNNFDLLITDLKLPNINGVEVALAAKAHNPKIKLIVISAHKEEYLNLIPKSIKFEKFIEKPFDLNEIISLVKQLL